MTDFYLRTAIYFCSYLLSMFALSAIDFNRFIKQGRVVQAQILFIVLSACLAYLFGSFLMAVVYYFN